MSSEFPELFSPFRIRHLELRNRIVAPPMLQMRPITSPEGIAWYRRLAAGGAGMVIVEVTSILRFGDELNARTLRPLVSAIHDEGAAAAIQLFPVHFGQATDPTALSAQEIAAILDGYARASHVCREAGFDAVEPHGAHGYLINQFFMPDRNKRTDEYGGTLEGRCRFAVRIVQRIRQTVGPDYLVFYRHTPTGKAYGMNDSLELARQLVAAGVDVLDISPAKEKMEADLAAPFKARFRVPVIAVNGMENPHAATAALRAGRCDLVAIGRSLITDAELPKKIQTGRMNEIIPCVKCDEGCFGHIRSREPVYCTQWKDDAVAPFVRGAAKP